MSTPPQNAQIINTNDKIINEEDIIIDYSYPRKKKCSLYNLRKILIIIGIAILLILGGILIYIFTNKKKRDPIEDDPSNNSTNISTNDSIEEENDNNELEIEEENNKNEFEIIEENDKNELEIEEENNKNESEIIEENDNNKSEIEEENEIEEEIKKEIIYKYSYSLKKNNSLTLSDNIELFNFQNLRRLNELFFISNEEIYNFVVYFYDKDTEKYYGYLIIDNSNIIKINEKINNQFLENNEYNINTPIINFTLSYKGEINIISYNNKLD